jgi:hypothetical protein
MPPGAVADGVHLAPRTLGPSSATQEPVYRRPFLDLLARLLSTGGEVRSAPDHAGYAE